MKRAWGPRARRRRSNTVRLHSLPMSIIRAAILLMMLLFFGLPMLWLVLAPSKTNTGLDTGNPLRFGSFQNYWTAIGRLWHYGNGQYVTWALNSAYYSVSIVVLAVLLCVCAGYAMAVCDFAGRKLALTATLIALITPGSAIVLPLFLEMNVAHLLNNPLSFILPSAFFPFGTYLMYVYFSTSVPRELLAAARVDGCSEWGVFWFVGVPLARPMVALVAFFAFVSQWNNFFLVQVMLSASDKLNLQVGLADIASTAFVPAPGLPVSLDITRPDVAMGGIILAVPVVIFFVVVQRHLLKGLLAGYGVG